MTTPIYSFPYPVLTDPPNGAAQIQALAEAVEDSLNTVETSLAADTTTLANPARAQLRTAVAQSIANNTATAVNFELEDFDTANGHSTSVNTSRYTAQVAGTYLLGGGFAFNASATNNRLGAWRKNGTDIDGGTTAFPGFAGNSNQGVMKTIMVELAVSDYIQIYVSQGSGGALNTAPGGCIMSILLIRNNSL